MKAVLQTCLSALKYLSIVLLLAGSLVIGWYLQRAAGVANAANTPADHSEKKSETLKRISTHRFILPTGYAERVGLQLGEVKRVDQQVCLPPLQATLALDADQQARIHSRFAGEVTALGQTQVKTSISPGEAEQFEARPLRYLDTVKKGDLLAIVWSKDLGEKKSELVEACSKLKADEETLNRLQQLEKEGASTERSLRDAQRNFDSDRIAVDRAERTLRSWRLQEDEIRAIREEASNRKDGKTSERQQSWARVEVRAPQDGVILEKNCSIGDIIDTNFDLFKIGQIRQLKVWTHIYEEDLPLLESLPKPYPLEVSLTSQPGQSYRGKLQQIGAVIDPNQHTALAMGTVNNELGKLRIGQLVTVKLMLPSRGDELLVPCEAVVEDGKESIVFVKSADNTNTYDRKCVQVIRRTAQHIVVKKTADGLQAGQTVVVRGALLLREALEEQRSEQASESSSIPVNTH